MRASIKTVYGYMIAGMSATIAVTALMPAWGGADADFELLLVALALVAPGLDIKRP